MTDQEYEDWLRSDNAYRCALVVAHTTPVMRFAVLPYTTTPDDPVPNIRYDARVVGGVAFTESIQLQNSVSRPSFGDIELDNRDGYLDYLFNTVWVNREIEVYLGDVRWQSSDFRLVMSGICEDLVSRNADTLNIVLRDKLEKLNQTVSEELVGGAGQNKDRLVPVTLGECHNISPVATNDIMEQYRWHIGPVEQCIEARDNAVPVAKSDNLATGLTTLSATPAGQVTLSVQGDKRGGTYRNTVANIIQELLTQYGATPLTIADIDTANFTAFNSAHPQPVGVYIPEQRTVLDVCAELADSLGASLAPSRLGKIRLLKIDLPPSGTPKPILPADYAHGSLRLADKSTVVAGIRLGYCRNWTPQQEIETGIPAVHRDMFSKEWYTVSVGDPAVAAEYRISTEVDQVGTLLLRTVDAQAEANRRLNLWKVPRKIFQVSCYANMLTLNLGDPVTLFGDRFGLDLGKTGIVVGLRSDWINGNVDVEVLV